MPGTWEVGVRIIPPEVTVIDRGPKGQEKECGFYTKCTKCSLEFFERDWNSVPAGRIDYEGNRGRSISRETSEGEKRTAKFKWHVRRRTS